jgi:DNA-binding NtrC family response regulator
MPDPATVLIVDDDAGMRLTLSRILSHEGYRVICAANGPEGIDIARAERLAVALVDFRMTGPNGGEVCASISQLQPDAAVCMITAHVTEEAADSAVANGAAGILYKPLDVSELLSLIAEETAHVRTKVAMEGGTR